MKPGIYEGIPFEQYCAIPAINKSGLDYFEQSPAHYFSSLNEPEGEKSKALRFGGAIHCRVLEPAEFEKRYCALPPDAPKRPTIAQIEAKKPSDATIELIAWWTKFHELANGREIISDQELTDCMRIAKAVRSHRAAKMLLQNGKFEVTLVWIDPEFGVLCKARVDWLSPDAMLDLKSTKDASPAGWWKQVKDYNLHRQVAWYSDGWEILTGEKLPFGFVAVEKEEPFATAVHFPKERVIDLGRKDNRKHLAKYAECLKAKNWPGYPDEVLEFDFPEFMFKEG